ncbi:MAG: hypothetical protein LBI34_03935 [Puniceicoccales bacterium]|jgi:hypothetical protein|nr:hypothetical protein [Puniceicoccales bacterium]
MYKPITNNGSRELEDADEISLPLNNQGNNIPPCIPAYPYRGRNLKPLCSFVVQSGKVYENSCLLLKTLLAILQEKAEIEEKNHEIRWSKDYLRNEVLCIPEQGILANKLLAVMRRM